MFKTYDVNKTGVLTEKELNSVFAPIEDAMPLWTQLRKEHHVLCVQWFLLIHSMNPTCPRNCYSNENNDLTLTGWVSEWILMLHIAPDLTLQTLVFLGYSDDISLLFTVSTACVRMFSMFPVRMRPLLRMASISLAAWVTGR